MMNQARDDGDCLPLSLEEPHLRLIKLITKNSPFDLLRTGHQDAPSSKSSKVSNGKRNEDCFEDVMGGGEQPVDEGRF